MLTAQIHDVHAMREASGGLMEGFNEASLTGASKAKHLSSSGRRCLYSLYHHLLTTKKRAHSVMLPVPLPSQIIRTAQLAPLGFEPTQSGQRRLPCARPLASPFALVRFTIGYSVTANTTSTYMALQMWTTLYVDQGSTPWIQN
jgi:hypothetical protein